MEILTSDSNEKENNVHPNRSGFEYLCVQDVYVLSKD